MLGNQDFVPSLSTSGVVSIADSPSIITVSSSESNFTAKGGKSSGAKHRESDRSTNHADITNKTSRDGFGCSKGFEFCHHAVSKFPRHFVLHLRPISGQIHVRASHKACGPSAPALTQVLWSWDMNDDPLSGPDGYSNGPGTGAVIAPPPYEGQQPSRIKDTNHGGSSYGAFTGDY